MLTLLVDLFGHQFEKKARMHTPDGKVNDLNSHLNLNRGYFFSSHGNFTRI